MTRVYIVWGGEDGIIGVYGSLQRAWTMAVKYITDDCDFNPDRHAVTGSIQEARAAFRPVESACGQYLNWAGCYSINGVSGEYHLHSTAMIYCESVE